MADPLNKKEPGKEELQEKNFIQESYKKNPNTLWVSLAITAAIAALFWGVGSWYFNVMQTQLGRSPFLQVTNREMSLFLWEFPEKMPQNVQNKTGYLPGFEYQERIGLKSETADNFVNAPPELLFLYHTWDRLIHPEFIQRAIPRKEFIEFLELQPEWKLEFWSSAPESYKKFIKGLHNSALKNLESLPIEILPLAVREAFTGWKNYRYEGELINHTEVKFSVLEQFLNTHPHYARNYWRNILRLSYPQYLATYTFGKYNPEDIVPNDELAPFLKVALFNFIQAEKGL